MKLTTRLFGIGMLLVMFISCVTTQTEQHELLQKTKKVAQEIGNSLITESGDPSAVSIAIMHDGDIIYAEGFGKRDVESNLPVDTDTRFNIGSISKIFTAAAILMLQEDGLLNLDDTVATLFPEFTMADERYTEITVRMLLNHTSGMVGTMDRNDITIQPYPEYLQQAMDDFAISMLKHDPGAFSPYCNDGFTVAQALVEHLSGLSFSQFLLQRIFQPLDMTNSSVGFHQQEENMAYAYIDRTVRLPKEYLNIVASGGITSTAIDVCKYASMIFSSDLLSQSSISEFLMEQKPKYVEHTDYDRLLSYGLGWDFTDWEPYRNQNIQVLGKTGGTLEYTSMIFVIPKSHSIVVLLCAGHIDPVSTTLPIVDSLLKESGQIPRETISNQIETLPTLPLPPDIEAYSGYYGSPNALFRIGFNREDSTMNFEVYNGSDFVQEKAVRHIGNGIFEKTAQQAWYTCKTLLGVTSIMEVRPYNQAEISMTRLARQDGTIEHEFTATAVLPVNLLPHDLYMPMYEIALIEELPSYLMLDDSVVYEITGSTQTSMALPTVRDQTPLRIDEEGRIIIGPYVCIDSDNIPPLEPGKPIVVDGETTTIWRRITEPGTFTCSVPDEGRIIVLGSDLSDMEDTLFSKKDRLEMDIFGSYVAFVAKDRTIFEPVILP